MNVTVAGSSHRAMPACRTMIRPSGATMNVVGMPWLANSPGGEACDRQDVSEKVFFARKPERPDSGAGLVWLKEAVAPMMQALARI
jgi:hypothetical protein